MTLERSEVQWNVWNQLRWITRHNPRVHLVLEFSRTQLQPHQIKQWIGEPIKAVLIPTSQWLINTKGYPVLSRSHQELLRTLLQVRSTRSVTVRDIHPPQFASSTPRKLF